MKTRDISRGNKKILMSFNKDSSMKLWFIQETGNSVKSEEIKILLSELPKDKINDSILGNDCK